MITYSDIVRLDGYAERLNALILKDYEYDSPREAMMKFYKSRRWLQVRDKVIKRDLGQDLAVEGLWIKGKILVHHIKPITYDDLINNPKFLLDDNYLITVSTDTHNIIHYGKPEEIITRTPGDTILW